MCNTREHEHPVTGNVVKLYSFDLNKCMEHLAAKYSKIKRHLAEKYVRENKGFILQMRQKRPNKVIKQEVKGAGVKAEMVKDEDGQMVKVESAAQALNPEIDAAEFEEQFEVAAMGVVADELPQRCVETFLKYIKEHHSGSTRLFQTFTEQQNGVKQEHVQAASELASNSTDISKKRSYSEYTNNNKPAAAQAN